MNESFSAPFVSGSDTSAAAAASKNHSGEGGAASDESRVLAFVRSCGPMGATDCEIELALNMLHQNASARRNGLVKKRALCDSGTKRKTKTGRQATVWVLGEGEALVGAPNDRVSRPKEEEIRLALENIKAIADHSRGTGGPAVSEDLQKVGRWLRWIARH